MVRPSWVRVSLSACAIAVLSACSSVGPDYVPPEPPVPDAWNAQLTEGLSEGEANLRTWWTTFNDPLLDSLIERATAGNLDLEQAYTRIKQSRARTGIARGEEFPDLDSTGELTRSRVSRGVQENIGEPQGRQDTFRSLGVDGTWEIDLWGRIARNVESANANLDASVEDYRDVLVILYSDVALNYIEARALQARIRFALGNVETQRGTLELVKVRRAAQLVPELDVQQAELNLATTESFVPQLEIQLAQTIHRLGVLLGQAPSTLYDEIQSTEPIPAPPARILVGLPHELLRQRPDIRRAEREIAAQNAQIGVATADLYPRFSLSGAFAFETFQGDMFEWENRAWQFGPAFRWNIFDGGRVRNNIRFQDFATEEQIVSYENTVLNALEEVENSMVAYTQEQIREAALARSVTAAERSVALVTELYRDGLTDFQNVLDMETRLFNQQDDFAQSSGFVSENLVLIYRALGGGWEPDTQELQEEVQDAAFEGEPIF